MDMVNNTFPISTNFKMNAYKKKTSRSLEGQPPPCEQGYELDLEWISPVVAELQRPQNFVRTNEQTDGDNAIVPLFSFGKGREQKIYCRVQ